MHKQSNATAHSSGLIHLYAHELAKRAETSPRDAIGALVFAAISLEAFMNDLSVYIDFGFASDSPELVAFGTYLSEMEQRNESLLRRLDSLWLFTQKRRLDFTKRPFRDLELLFKARNSLVHLRPTKLTPKTPGAVQMTAIWPKFKPEFIALGILKEEAFEASSWPQVLQHAAIGKWATGTIVSVVNEVIKVLPSPAMKMLLQHNLLARNPFD